MNLSEYYTTVKNIQNYAPEKYIKLSLDLVDIAENPDNEMKTKFFKSFTDMMDIWIKAGNLKVKSNATSDEDKKKIQSTVNDLTDGKNNYISKYGKLPTATFPNGTTLIRPTKFYKKVPSSKKKPPPPPPQDKKIVDDVPPPPPLTDEQKARKDGESYTVKKESTDTDTAYVENPTGVEPEETKSSDSDSGDVIKIRVSEEKEKKIAEKLKNLSNTSMRTNVVKEAIREGLQLRGYTSKEEFVQNASKQKIDIELNQIREAIGYVDVAKADIVGTDVNEDLKNDLDTQKNELNELQNFILSNPRYIKISKMPRAPDGPKKIPDKVEAEPEEENPEGNVQDSTGSFDNNPLVLEANEYIRQIGTIPQSQVPREVQTILVSLVNAIRTKNIGKLKETIDKARTYFSSPTNTSNTNSVFSSQLDKKITEGKVLDQGLEDFKKIKQDEKVTKNEVIKLEDLRADAQEGEKERINNSFNKDILNLSNANQILKTSVNLKNEEIKDLKQTIQQKLKMENDNMLQGIAPVFQKYLQLNIDNVVMDGDEENEIYYNTVI